MTLRGLLIAFKFLTRIPVPSVAAPAAGDLGHAAVWFPLVGGVIGVTVLALGLLGGLIGPWSAALFALVAWVWITGALHLDALADVSDALGASHGAPERFEEVRKDPHVGALGVIAVVLQLMAKLVMLAQLPAAVAVPALVLVPAWARWGALAWSLAAPPSTPGLGARLREGRFAAATVVWALVLGVLSLWLAPLLLVGALVAAPAIALYWRLRVDSMNGDCLGASVEVMETLLLIVLAVSSGISARSQI